MPLRLDAGRQFVKAVPSIEAGQRVVYFEASTERRDLQGERILVSALEESIGYFLKFGRIDLDHASVTGEIRGQKVNPYEWEIGKPIDVRVDRSGEVPSIWVKAGLYTPTNGASNSFTRAADIFWDSLHTNPPTVWYPSVQGYVLAEQQVIEGTSRTQEIRRIQWHSVGLSRTPVNHHVSPVSTVPLSVFMKSFTNGHLDLQKLLAEFSAAMAPAEKKFDPDALSLPTPGLNAEKVQAILEALATNQPAVGVQALVDGGLVSHAEALAVMLALTDDPAH